ncbi:MAG: hypothetical protein LVR00_06615 [Rhabdochlamydiaceae bacterium]
MVQNFRLSYVPIDPNDPRAKMEPHRIALLITARPGFRIEEQYIWVCRNGFERRFPFFTYDVREGVSDPDRLFFHELAARKMILPSEETVRGDTDAERFVDRPFRRLNVMIDPRVWFGYGELNGQIPPLMAKAIFDRIVEISNKYPLLPVQVSLTGRAERELPRNFTLPLVESLAGKCFFVDTNNTVDANLLPEALKSYLGSIFHPYGLSEDYLNDILRRQFDNANV